MMSLDHIVICIWKSNNKIEEKIFRNLLHGHFHMEWILPSYISEVFRRWVSIHHLSKLCSMGTGSHSKDLQQRSNHHMQLCWAKIWMITFIFHQIRVLVVVQLIKQIWYSDSVLLPEQLRVTLLQKGIKTRKL